MDASSTDQANDLPEHGPDAEEASRRALEVLAEAQLEPGRAEEAISEIVDLGDEAAKVLGESMELLDGRGRRIAAIALARLAVPGTFDALAETIESSALEIRGELPILLRALGPMHRSGTRVRALRILDTYLGHPDPLVRASVADALFSFPAEEAITRLHALRGDPDAFVRDRAQAALAGGSDDEERSPHERVGPGQQTSTSDATSPQIRHLLGALTHPDHTLRERARRTFLQHPDRLQILRACGLGNDVALRRSLFEALGEGDMPEARDFIASALERMELGVEDVVLLLRACDRQKMHHPGFIAEQARRHLRHPDIFVRAELANLIASTGGPPLDALPHLLRDSDFFVRERAARAWHKHATRDRARIVPEVLDLTDDIFNQPRLTREDIILLTILLSALVRILRDGGFVEERFATLAARALASAAPPLRRQGAALLRTIGQENTTRIDPAAYVPVDRLLLATSAEDVVLALELLQRASPSSIDRNLDTIIRFVYRADAPQLLTTVEVLKRAGTSRSRDVLNRLTQHSDPDVAAAARDALSPQHPPRGDR